MYLSLKRMFLKSRVKSNSLARVPKPSTVCPQSEFQVCCPVAGRMTKYSCVSPPLYSQGLPGCQHISVFLAVFLCLILYFVYNFSCIYSHLTTRSYALIWELCLIFLDFSKSLAPRLGSEWTFSICL